jgi:hypothetical protein
MSKRGGEEGAAVAEGRSSGEEFPPSKSPNIAGRPPATTLRAIAHQEKTPFPNIITILIRVTTINTVNTDAPRRRGGAAKFRHRPGSRDSFGPHDPATKISSRGGDDSTPTGLELALDRYQSLYFFSFFFCDGNEQKYRTAHGQRRPSSYTLANRLTDWQTN